MAEPLKRGDLYFVKPPGFVGKVRPAVIVQADKYNADPPSVTVCLLTSHLVESRLRVRIDPAPENGLSKPSHVMIDKAMSLPLDRLDKPDWRRIGRATGGNLGLPPGLARPVAAYPSNPLIGVIGKNLPIGKFFQFSAAASRAFSPPRPSPSR